MFEENNNQNNFPDNNQNSQDYSDSSYNNFGDISEDNVNLNSYNGEVTSDFKTENYYNNQTAYSQNNIPQSQFQNRPHNVNANTTVNSYEWGESGTNPQHNYYNSYKQKPKKGKKPVSRGAIAGILIVCILFSAVLGIGGGAGTYFLLSRNGNSNSTLNISKSDSTGGSEKSPDGKVLSTEEISNKVADSVVEIVTETVTNSFFYGQAITEGAGSGVIIDKNGYIVTNNHVIENAKSIKVKLRSGNEYTAKLIGADKDKDVALIKINPDKDEELTVATFGDSSQLAVGDKAVVIGNPLGRLGGTVTDGIISALDREITIDNTVMNLLQTDAAVNPGNSGGGLFDGQGNLVGIIVAKASSDSSTGSVEGLGFAIPINDVEKIIGDLKNYGYVKGKPAEIGVVLQDYMNMVYVYSVKEGSAAEKAGLEKGDKIMKIDGNSISSSSDVKKAVLDSKAGTKLKFEIERNGSTKTVTVTVEEASSNTTDNTSSNYETENPFNGFPDDEDSIWDNYGY
ncbi:MAG: trypsin-like peptidase domain-containing protein [Oscillospiraceae bacterium]|nr:trypsin-like peptidase domain-containing protein [Oscillospiraceae bacterium]